MSLFLDDVKFEELPEAPPVAKENLNAVCRSDVFEHIGETIIMVTWILFIIGLRVSVTAEFNRRMQTGTLSVGGKVVF